jgi:uncharacterized protein (DUF302 family)
MRNLFIVLICLITINGFALPPALAESKSGLSIEDAESVEDAVERISAILEKQGFDIVLVVNHAAAAAAIVPLPLELRPTQVIYARQPRFIERLTLKRSHTIGIDLPVKFLVYEEENGETQVTSNPIGYLVDRHDIKPKDFILWWLQYRVNQFGKPASGLVTIPSNQTLDETVESLKTAIPSPPFGFPLEVDFNDGPGSYRKHRGSRLPFLLVFGNPVVGTPLMQEDQRIGLDLPQEYLVWEDRDGGVYITWNDPFFIAARYDIQDPDNLLTVISGALNKFAQIGAGEIDPKAGD